MLNQQNDNTYIYQIMTSHQLESLGLANTLSCTYQKAIIITSLSKDYKHQKFIEIIQPNTQNLDKNKPRVAKQSNLCFIDATVNLIKGRDVSTHSNVKLYSKYIFNSVKYCKFLLVLDDTVFDDKLLKAVKDSILALVQLFKFEKNSEKTIEQFISCIGFVIFEDDQRDVDQYIDFLSELEKTCKVHGNYLKEILSEIIKQQKIIKISQKCRQLRVVQIDKDLEKLKWFQINIKYLKDNNVIDNLPQLQTMKKIIKRTSEETSNLMNPYQQLNTELSIMDQFKIQFNTPQEDMRQQPKQNTIVNKINFLIGMHKLKTEVSGTNKKCFFKDYIDIYVQNGLIKNQSFKRYINNLIILDERLSDGASYIQVNDQIKSLDIYFDTISQLVEQNLQLLISKTENKENISFLPREMLALNKIIQFLQKQSLSYRLLTKMKRNLVILKLYYIRNLPNDQKLINLLQCYQLSIKCGLFDQKHFRDISKKMGDCLYALQKYDLAIICYQASHLHWEVLQTYQKKLKLNHSYHYGVQFSIDQFEQYVNLLVKLGLAQKARTICYMGRVIFNEEQRIMALLSKIIKTQEIHLQFLSKEIKQLETRMSKQNITAITHIAQKINKQLKKNKF